MNKLLIVAMSVMIAMSLVAIADADNDFIHHPLLNDWTGMYAGVNGGVILTHAQLKSHQLGFTNTSATCNTHSNFSTPFTGLQLGYLYHIQNDLVSGIEANVSVNAHQKEVLGCHSDINPNIYDHFIFRNQMQSSIKGRVGRPISWNKNPFLPYLTLGASFANVELAYNNEGGDYYSKRRIQAGWLVGTGLEWSFKPRWSFRAEYDYVGYGHLNLKIPSVYGLLDADGKGRVNLNSSNMVVALNYWL